MELSFHEGYHYWQGLRLPFLHRYALISLQVIAQAFQALDKLTDLHAWDCILPELTRLTLASRWYCSAPGEVSVQPSSNHNDDDGGCDLTPLDLLEGAASLAQWQTLAAKGSERWSWLHFSRWSKRKPCYKKALDLVAHAIEDEALALRCFIPLVNAAFHSSEPVLTLGYLTCILTRPEIASWRSAQEPCNWREMLLRALDLIPFKGKPDCDARILGSPYHRITENWIGTKPPHPMLTEMSQKWLEHEKKDDRYKILLDQPGYLDGDFVAEALRDFSPTTIMCFHFANGETRNVFNAAGDVVETQIESSKWFWLQALTMYSVIRRASGAHFDPDLRLCYHKDCPEYLPNYCNSYPRIPSEFTRCTFTRTVAEMREGLKEFQNADKH